MEHETEESKWPSRNILDFHAGLPDVWGSNPGGEKESCLCIFTVVSL